MILQYIGEKPMNMKIEFWLVVVACFALVLLTGCGFFHWNLGVGGSL